MDDDDDDDLIDDDEDDEDVSPAVIKTNKDMTASFDSETGSNVSPVLNPHKNRPMRHAATLVADNSDAGRSQNFESEAKHKAVRGNSFPVGGGSHTGKIQPKKTKLIAV